MDGKDACIGVAQDMPNEHQKEIEGKRDRRKGFKAGAKDSNTLLIILKVTYSCKKFCVSSAGRHD